VSGAVVAGAVVVAAGVSITPSSDRPDENTAHMIAITVNTARTTSAIPVPPTPDDTVRTGVFLIVVLWSTFGRVSEVGRGLPLSLL
jgi:hypothetical protein